MSKQVILILISLVGVLSSHAKFSTVTSTDTLDDLKKYFPTGDYRRTSGDEKLCPHGRLEWVENDSVLKLGAAHPVLFHSFNSSYVDESAMATVKCRAKTETRVKALKTEKEDRRTITEKVHEICKKQTTLTDYELTASKIEKKMSLSLKMKVRHSKNAKNNLDLTCIYERTLEE